MSCYFIPPGPLLGRLAIQTERERDRRRGRERRWAKERRKDRHGTNFTTIFIPLEMLVHETMRRPLEQQIRQLPTEGQIIIPQFLFSSPFFPL